MIRQLLSATVLLFSVSAVKAQNDNLLWAQGFGSTGFDMVRDIATDSDGNVISVGQFTNTVDFDPGPGVSNLTSAGSNDIFIKKQDAAGNLIWVRHFGQYDGDAAASVGVDASNNIYVTGVFRYDVDFDPGPGQYILGTWGTNAGQIFLLKLDEDGDLIWVNQMGNTNGTSQGLTLAVEPGGLVVVAGTFHTTVDFEPFNTGGELTANSTNYGIFVASYSADGFYNWAHGFGGTDGNNFPEDITLDVSNNVILTGSFGGDCDLDPTAGSQIVSTNGYDDAFIMKFSSSGAFYWAKSIGGAWGDSGMAVVADSNDDIFFTGYFYMDTDLDPNAGTANYSVGSNQNTFITKLAWDGSFVWAKTFQDGYNRPHSVDLDEDDNLYITGSFSQTNDFDPGVGNTSHTSASNYDDIFLVKLDNDGVYQWSKGFGNINDDRGEAITVVNSDEIYMAGFFDGTVDFNSSADTYNLITVGSVDCYVSKFGTCSVDNTVSLSGVTLTANQSGAAYQWMNCSTFSNVPGATSQNFSPTDDGDYAVIVTLGQCKDTSICYTVQGVGLNDAEQTYLAVYPNPAQSNLTVQSAEKPTAIYIFNTAGTLIQTETKTTFSVESLPAGMYFLQIQLEQGIRTIRFVKE